MIESAIPQLIKEKEDTLELQNDIDHVGAWARKWGMRFQPVKCNNETDQKQMLSTL